MVCLQVQFPVGCDVSSSIIHDELSLVLSLLLVTFFCNAVAVLLNYTSTISFHAIDEEFFSLGFSAPEIFLFLVNAAHGTRLSLRQFKRVLSNRGCALKRHLLSSSCYETLFVITLTKN